MGLERVSAWCLGSLWLCLVLCPSFVAADELVWVDYSSGALTSGVSAMAAAPDDASVLYVGGRGYVARSQDGGATWQASLLLTGSSSALEGEGLIEVDAQDLSRFDDSEALYRFEEMQAELFEQLADEYGEQAAEEMILSMSDELREEAFLSLLDDAGEYQGERDYVSRRQRLAEAGFAEEEAELLAADPVAVWDLVVVPEAPNHVYAATGRGLFRSTDRGKRWQLILRAGGETDYGQGVLSVGVSEQGKRIVAGTVVGLLTSTDGARTWSRMLGELSSGPVVRVRATIDPMRFYALSLSKLYASDDGGENFQALSTTFNASNVRDLEVLPDDADGLLVSTFRLVLQSLDGGQSFEALPSTGLDASGLGRLHVPPGATSTVYVLAAAEVFVLENQAKSWSRLGNGLLGQDCYVLGSDASGLLWLGTATGIHQSVKGEKAALQMELLKELQQIWAAEPEPAKVVRAAMAFHRLDGIDTDEWVSRAFWSRLAPRVDVRLRIHQEVRFHDYSTHLLFTPDEPATLENLLQQHRAAQFFGREPNLRWDVMAFWDLGDLLSDAVELQLNALSSQVYKAKRRLASKVIKLYIKRRGLQAQIAAGKKRKLDAQVSNLLKLEEMTAMLDAYSGNYFTAAYHSVSSRKRSPQADLTESGWLLGPLPTTDFGTSLGWLDAQGDRQ